MICYLVEFPGDPLEMRFYCRQDSDNGGEYGILREGDAWALYTHDPDDIEAGMIVELTRGSLAHCEEYMQEYDTVTYRQ